MSRMEQIQINRLIHEDKVKAAKLLNERGYSVCTIAKIMNLSESSVRFMVRRE